MDRPATGLGRGVPLQGFDGGETHGKPRTRDRDDSKDGDRDQTAFLGPVARSERGVRSRVLHALVLSNKQRHATSVGLNPSERVWLTNG